MAEEREEPNLFQLIGPPIAEDQGTVFDYQSSSLEKLQSGFGRQWDTNPFISGLRMMNVLTEDLSAIMGGAEWVYAEKARAEVAGASLDLSIPDNGISRYELETLKYLKKREREQQQLTERNQSTLGAALEFTGGLGAGVVDPLNIVSAFIPIVPEARYAAWVAQASGAFGRAAVRAGVGAVEGAAGAALLEPLSYYGATSSQLDYTAADSFINVVFGGVFGSGLHAVGGVGYDVYNAGKLDAARSIGEALPYITQREAAGAAPDSVKMEALHGAVRSLENDLPVKADETFDAWHGSPHAFDEFKIDAIGTGEGTQAFGFGLYFAQAKEVASRYMETTATMARRIFAERNGEAPAPSQSGFLYQVRLALKEGEYIDYDRPFSEQTGPVRDALEEMGIRTDTDESVGDLLKPRLGNGGDELVAQDLLKYGIKGIRFLDGDSRDAGQGAYNYVVFRPEDVRVISRNGEPIVKPEAPTRPMDDPADVEVSAMADRAAMKADDLEQVAADTDFLDQQINGMKSRDMWSEADEAALAAGEDTAKKLETTASVYRAAAVCMTE